MNPITRYLPATAIDAMVAEADHYCNYRQDRVDRVTHYVMNQRGECGLGTGLRALGLHVAGRESATMLAVALIAYHEGLVATFNFWRDATAQRIVPIDPAFADTSVPPLRLDGRLLLVNRDILAAVSDAVLAFTVEFDGGRLTGDRLRRALGRATTAEQEAAVAAAATILRPTETVAIVALA